MVNAVDWKPTFWTVKDKHERSKHKLCSQHKVNTQWIQVNICEQI